MKFVNYELYPLYPLFKKKLQRSKSKKPNKKYLKDASQQHNLNKNKIKIIHFLKKSCNEVRAKIVQIKRKKNYKKLYKKILLLLRFNFSQKWIKNKIKIIHSFGFFLVFFTG